MSDLCPKCGSDRMCHCILGNEEFLRLATERFIAFVDNGGFTTMGSDNSSMASTTASDNLAARTLRLLKNIQWSQSEPAFPGAPEQNRYWNCPSCGAFSGRFAHDPTCNLAAVITLAEDALGAEHEARWQAELITIRAEVERLTENVAGLHKSCNLHAVSAHEHRQRADQAEAEVEQLTAAIDDQQKEIGRLLTLVETRNQLAHDADNNPVPADDLAARVLSVRDQLNDLGYKQFVHGAGGGYSIYSYAADLLTAALEPPAVAGEGSG